MENGHRNSGFFLEKLGGSFHCYVSSPEGILSVLKLSKIHSFGTIIHPYTSKRNINASLWGKQHFKILSSGMLQFFSVQSVLTCSPCSTKVSSVNSFHPASCKSARSGAKASAAATSWCRAHDFCCRKNGAPFANKKHSASSRDVYSFRNHSFSHFPASKAASTSPISDKHHARITRASAWPLAQGVRQNLAVDFNLPSWNIEQLPPSFKIDKEGCKYPVESRSETLRHFRSRGGLRVPKSLPDVFKSSKQWQRRAN